MLVNLDSALSSLVKEPIISTSQIATLWAGYGSVVRVQTSSTSQILKRITLQPPEDGEDLSHQRKHISYLVETCFYEHPLLVKSIGNAVIDVPQVDKVLKKENGKGDIEISILMSDLSPNFPISTSSTTLAQTLSSLRWLAAFHAHFWNLSSRTTNGSSPAPSPLATSPPGVWSYGGYWNLPTRLAELSQLPSSSKYQRISQRTFDLLHGPQSQKFHTLLHGDPKVENIMFGMDPTTPARSSISSILEDGPIEDSLLPTCAFHDFQYTGYGPGAIDVAHFLATSAHRTLLNPWTVQNLLRFYHDKSLEYLAPDASNREDWAFDVFRKQFDWAMVDWVRFMMGWGRWGNHTWAVQWADRVVDEMLQNGA
ncbi:hypothetical protein HDV00_003080 [Rhizophlyctis rosea]|nr:hypothetical protein HDV00_003080 [Rhizophlyctis rosea]